MPDYKSLTYTRWDCKYHVVFIPKRRQKLIYGHLRKYLGGILHELARRKSAEILEGHMMRDHIHLCISIPSQRRGKATGMHYKTPLHRHPVFAPFLFRRVA